MIDASVVGFGTAFAKLLLIRGALCRAANIGIIVDHIMHTAVNTPDIKSLAGILPTRVPSKIGNAIYQASAKSGVDFSYLVNQAKAESNFNPQAKAKTSSATGLYQFIDATWLQMVDRYGADYGIDTQGMSKRDVLNMRKDPEAASFMAAAFASENEKFLNTHWGGDVGATELYFAHFLGASGAASFLNARDENPIARADDLFPKAARANRGVFYDRQTNEPRTLEEVYQFFDRKFKDSFNTSNSLIAEAPVPDRKPDIALASQSVPVRAMGDHPIMQRSHAMRLAAGSDASQQNEEQQSGHHGQISGRAFLTQVASFPIEQTARSDRFAETSIYTKSSSHAAKRMPFLSLMTHPVDVMLLKQTVTPKSAISSNFGDKS